MSPKKERTQKMSPPSENGRVQFSCKKHFTKPFDITDQVGDTLQKAIEIAGENAVLSGYHQKCADSARNLAKVMGEEGKGYEDVVKRLQDWKPGTRRAKSPVDKLILGWDSLSTDEKSQFTAHAVEVARQAEQPQTSSR